MLITSIAMDAADLARSFDINRYNYTISLQHLNGELHLFKKSNALCTYILGDTVHAERHSRAAQGNWMTKTAAKGCMNGIKTNHRKYLKQLLACTHLGKVRFANLHDFNERSYLFSTRKAVCIWHPVSLETCNFAVHYRGQYLWGSLPFLTCRV